MSEHNLRRNMAEAWRQRGERSVLTLAAINTGAALFKPETIIAAQQDYLRAVEHYEEWL